jgi:hypothetical protein
MARVFRARVAEGLIRPNEETTMQLNRKLLAGAAAVVLSVSATAAAAADPIYFPPPAPAPMAPPPAPYNWAGFYVGPFVGRTILFPVPAVGLNVGFNFQPSNFVVGIEGRVGLLVGAPPPNVFIDARVKAGFTLGQTGNVLLYGVGSIGTVLGAGAPPYYTVGGGVEFGIGRVSIFAESVAIGFGGVLAATAFQGGLNFHFN